MTEEASATEDVAVEEDSLPVVHDDENSVVAYTGRSSARSIAAADWARMDIDGEDRVWNADNGKAIPTEDLTDGELVWLSAEPDFVIRPASVGPE